MFEIILYAFVLFFTIAFIFIFFASYRLTTKIDNGLLLYFFYALLIGSAISMLLSSRTLGLEESELASSGQGFLSGAVIKGMYLIILLAVFERTINFIQQNKLDFQRFLLLFVITLVWVANVVMPSFVAQVGEIHFTYIMSFVVMLGIALSGQIKMGELLLHTKNAMVAFVLLSLLIIVVNPSFVLNFSYTNGYIPGLPRFYGLATYATIMGAISATAIWLLIAFPYQSKNITRLLIAACFVALVLTQAKAVMTSFLIGAFLIYVYKPNTSWLKTHVLSQRPNAFRPIIIIPSIILLMGIASALVAFMFIDINALIYRNFSLETLDKLTSITGRDIIWEYSIAQFFKYPIFGYGIDFLSYEHRNSIGMPFATNAHNQFIDAAARAGLFGLISYIILYGFLLAYAIKLRKVTHGLSLALISYIIIFSITAVPLDLVSLTLQTIPMYLLLFIISSNIRKLEQNNISVS